LAPSASAIDCGHSPTTARLLAGVLAGQKFRSRLIGSPGNSRRRMAAIVEPLRRRGALISGAAHPSDPVDLTLPLEIGPLSEGTRLAPIEYRLNRPNDHAKGALLFSGLFASGPTVLFEPLVSRDHTERLLA